MVRFKNRHLVLALVWKDGKMNPSLKEMVILNAIRQSIKENFGDVGGGLSNAALRLAPYNPLSNVCVLRCGRDQQREVITALALINQIGGRTVLIRLLRVCGTLTRCKEVAVEFNEKLFVPINPSESQLRRQAEELKRIQLMRD